MRRWKSIGEFCAADLASLIVSLDVGERERERERERPLIFHINILLSPRAKPEQKAKNNLGFNHYSNLEGTLHLN